jgi:uncharacterized damage-inducible protein DinB
MDETFRKILWQQFGASIQMLENAIQECPEEVWSDQINFFEYWYIAYHTLFWLDFYLSESPQAFTPHAPFTMDEASADEILPERVYSKAELIAYLEFAREKCRTRIASLTDESARQRFVLPHREFSILELHLYNMRHVQHHAAQLNLLLRQRGAQPPRWVSRADPKLEV